MYLSLVLLTAWMLWITLAVSFTVLVIWSSYAQWRDEQLSRVAQIRLRERVQERERISRDLEDTLLQAVQGLILRFSAIADAPMVDEALRDKMHQALTLADTVLAEGRDRVRDLRGLSEDIDGLEQGLVETGRILALSSACDFAWSTRGNRTALEPLIQDELFHLGRQALQTAFQHAAATQVTLLLVYATSFIEVIVRDNGSGAQYVDGAWQRSGDWVTSAVHERATRISARLRTRSKRAWGTEVRIRVPASVAYRDQLPGRRHSWLERLPFFRHR